MRHLDEGTIHAWLDGALGDEAARKAEEHAARCTECASAVADARGLLAASAQILMALDNAPSGVIPWGGRAAPVPQETLRRWPAWTTRIAASIAIVAVGTMLWVRNPNDPARLTNDERTAVGAPGAAPPVRALAVPLPPVPEKKEKDFANSLPATAGNAPAQPPASPQSVAEGFGGKGKVEATDRLKPNETRGVQSASSDTAARGRDAAAVVPARADAPSDSADVALRRRQVAALAADSVAGGASGNASYLQSASTTVDAAKANAAPAARAAQLDRSATSPHSLKLLREETITGASRVVQRRVYEVREGVQVTLAISAPRADATATAAAPAAEPQSTADLGPGVNSIEWTDTDGDEFTLSGALPLDSLRALRPLLPAHPQMR